MWTNPTTAAKCPRSDCIHYKAASDAAPCRDCTCNRESTALARAFRYESKIKREEAKP